MVYRLARLVNMAGCRKTGGRSYPILEQIPFDAAQLRDRDVRPVRKNEQACCFIDFCDPSAGCPVYAARLARIRLEPGEYGFGLLRQTAAQLLQAEVEHRLFVFIQADRPLGQPRGLAEHVIVPGQRGEG